MADVRKPIRIMFQPEIFFPALALVVGFFFVLALSSGWIMSPPSDDEVNQHLKWSFLRECTLKATGVVDRPGEHCARAWTDMVAAYERKSGANAK